MGADEAMGGSHHQWSYRPQAGVRQVESVEPDYQSEPSGVQRAEPGCHEDLAWPSVSQPVSDCRGQQRLSSASDLESQGPHAGRHPGRSTDPASAGLSAKLNHHLHDAGMHQQSRPTDAMGYAMHADATAAAAPSWQPAEPEAAVHAGPHPRIVVNSQPLLQATLQGSLHHPVSPAQPVGHRMHDSWPILPGLQTQQAHPAGHRSTGHEHHLHPTQHLPDAHSMPLGFEPTSQAMLPVSQATNSMSAQDQISMRLSVQAEPGDLQQEASTTNGPSASRPGDMSRMPTSNNGPPLTTALGQAGLPGHDAHAGVFSHEGAAQGAHGPAQQQAGHPRQPLAARRQQEERASGEYDHLLPISPISGRRMPGQENAGPGTANSMKQPGSPASAPLPSRCSHTLCNIL